MAKRYDPPAIDSRIEVAGPTRLRDFNGDKLKKLTDNILVVQDGGRPVAVLMSYKLYVDMQSQAVR
jgi:hypothetical protein